jgi:hypothetical protein
MQSQRIIRVQAFCGFSPEMLHLCCLDWPASHRLTLDKRISAQYALAMVATFITRKLSALALALTLVFGGAPVVMAAPGMADCGMAMGTMDMQSSMAQDQNGMAASMPMQKHQMPCKDIGGFCSATCSSAVSLPDHHYSQALASAPAEPGWALQTNFASVFSRPEIPPPIAIL